MAKPELDFKSKEEFRDVCRYLAARMHYLNRVSMGEQKLAWTVASVIEGVGRAFDEGYDDPDVRAAFGDGWTKGTVDRDDLVPALMDLAFPPTTE